MSDRDGPASGNEDLADAPTDESEWRFSLADIEERQAEADARAETIERHRRPIEPGNPSLEGTAFVLLGVFFTLFVLSRLVIG